MIYVKMIYICKTSKTWYWPHVSTITTEMFFASPFLKQGREGGTENNRLLQSFLCDTQAQ